MFIFPLNIYMFKKALLKAKPMLIVSCMQGAGVERVGPAPVQPTTEFADLARPAESENFPPTGISRIKISPKSAKI